MYIPMTQQLFKKNSRSFMFLPETGLVHDINELSNEFQTVGPHEGKACRPKVIFLDRLRYSQFQMRR